VLADTEAGFNSTCSGDAECSLWFMEGEGGHMNVSALAESLGCDFADLCSLPGGSCDALEAQLRQNATGSDALCSLAYDVLILSFDTAVNLCSNNTNCTAWMYDEAIDAATDLIDAVGCSLPCATESCGNLTTPTDDTPASQREALCNFLFFDVEEADAAQAEVLYESLMCSRLVEGLGPWGCDYHCQAGFDAGEQYSEDMNAMWCHERALIRRGNSSCWDDCADETVEAIEAARICSGELQSAVDACAATIPPNCAITSLVVVGSENTVAIPAGIASLFSLTELAIHTSNLLPGSLPSEVGTLTNLVKLTLTGVPPNNNNTAWYPTSLTSDLIEDRRAIAELVSWDLMHVGLTGTLPSELGWLTNLVELDLSFNQFEGRLPSTLGHLSALETMDLSHNLLSSRLPQTMNQYTSMTLVSAEGNVGLCGDLPDSIQDITSDYNTAIGSTCPDLCYQGLMEDSPRSCPDLSLSSCVCPADTRRVVKWNILTGGSAEAPEYQTGYTCETDDTPGELSTCQAVL